MKDLAKENILLIITGSFRVAIFNPLARVTAIIGCIVGMVKPEWGIKLTTFPLQLKIRVHQVKHNIKEHPSFEA